MKIGITHRLFWSLLAAAALAVITMVVIMQWSVGRGFIRYVNSMEKAGVALMASDLVREYNREKNWQFLKQHPERWQQLVASALPQWPPPFPEGVDHPPPPRNAGMEPPPRPMPPHLARQLVERLYLMDAGRMIIAGTVGANPEGETTPVLSDGQVVGYLGIVNLTKPADDHQLRFIKEQRYALMLVAMMLVLFAALLAFPLARRLVRPIRALADATHRLSAGEFTTRVPIDSDDELGRLAGDFNTLALTLERNEQARRQWVADISHELRTPVAVMRAEIEAIQDGVRQCTPDTIHSLHDEMLCLNRLVDDLHQLAMSDLGALSYRKQEVDLVSILDNAVELYRNEFAARNISISSEALPHGCVSIFGDPGRIHQLFANLLDNSLKYTDEGGRLLISMTTDKSRVIIDFKDTAPTVTATDLERLFERLYRVESSRNRATGGAGLGLSICRNIVEAHDGSIDARKSELGGLWVRVELPMKEGA